MWAHPRSRGENGAATNEPSFTAGSSPLTRGKHLSAMFDRSAGGLIPAHAGKTACISCARCRAWAHPRSRGENDKASSILGSLAGSSPLTRGKRCSLPRSRRRARAHPRSRGENIHNAQAGDLVCGSSPLTRGKLGMRGPPRPPLGLIPAHAGKTRRRRARR